MNQRLRDILRHLKCQPGASEAALQKLADGLGTELPLDYMEFLGLTDGADGFYGYGYWLLHSTEEVRDLTKLSGAQEFAPGLVLIASDGGGIAFGIDTRCGIPAQMEYVEMDLIGLDWNEVFARKPTLVELFEYRFNAPAITGE